MIAFACLVGFGAVTLLMLPRRGCQMPLSERLCRRLLLLAAWLEHVSVSWDAAIVRYRLERNVNRVGALESTRLRESRAALAPLLEEVPDGR